MELGFIPAERIRVFISSAQNNEGLFAWENVRRRTKAYLGECPYLNPFIIEDTASASPSSQFYQRQLQKADIVVLLVKGEVRKGTATEYALATKLKKPLLVYFLEDEDAQPSVDKLKKDLQTTDYCTYRALKSFDTVERDIRNDIIENVIRYFQDMPLHNAENISTSEAVFPEIIIEPEKPSIPTKNALALFRSSYNHIYDLLGTVYLKNEETKEKTSALHALGINALEWLVKGTLFECDAEITHLVELAKDIYSDTQWLSKRWDAIRFELQGDVSSALEAEKEALIAAKTANLPQWIINDILIDCRNFELEEGNLNRELRYENDAQQELNQNESIVYLPVLDRYLSEIYDGIFREEYRISTASVNTVLYGTNLGAVITNLQNYFFSSLLFGSYTHMVVSRTTLANILSKYGHISNDVSLLFESLKLLVIAGKGKEFKTTLDCIWDKVYFEVSSNADAIWNLTDNVLPDNKNTIKQAVATKLGLYLSEEAFGQLEAYIDNISTDIYWGNSENFFECLRQNQARLNPEMVVSRLSEIISERRFHLGGNLSNILMSLDLSAVGKDTQQKLCDALTEQISFIVKNNGTPQIIAALEKQNPEIFSKLKMIPENGLTGLEKSLYDINMGGSNWIDVLSTEIKTARHQFEVNNRPGYYAGFANAPHAMIKNIVRSHYDSTMDRLLIEEYLPLCIEIFNSYIDLREKINCIDCLCDILTFALNDRAVLPKELLIAISKLDASQGSSVLGISRVIFSCRILMLKVLIDIAQKEDLFEWSFSYSKRDTSERIALAECIEQFVSRSLSKTTDIDSTIVSIVLQCFEDDRYHVRIRACKCLVCMLGTQYRDLIESKLYEAAIDPSHLVRNSLFQMCTDEKTVDKGIRDNIFDILKNDANYVIRKKVLDRISA